MSDGWQQHKPVITLQYEERRECEAGVIGAFNNEWHTVHLRYHGGARQGQR